MINWIQVKILTFYVLFELKHSTCNVVKIELWGEMRLSNLNKSYIQQSIFQPIS